MTVKCDSCGFSADIPSEWSGRNVACPKCKHEFVAGGKDKVSRDSTLITIATILIIVFGLSIYFWADNDFDDDLQEASDDGEEELDVSIDDAETAGQLSSLDSFCGIKFGTKLGGGLERSKFVNYFTAVVELDKPFRGAHMAKVYAGVKTRRIFKVEVCPLYSSFTPGSEIADLLERKYGKGSCKEIFGEKRVAFDDGSSIVVSWEKIGTGEFTTTTKEVVTGYFPASGEVESHLETQTQEKWRYGECIKATNGKYKDIADNEYKEESTDDAVKAL